MLTPFDTLLAIETGFRYEFSENHFFRFALLGPMGTLRYARPIGPVQIEITGSTLGDQHLLQIDFRHTFGKK